MNLADAVQIGRLENLIWTRMKWVSMDICLDHHQCMCAHGIEDIANKLFEVSTKAQERARLHDEGYALVTARNAADAAERGRKQGRG